MIGCHAPQRSRMASLITPSMIFSSISVRLRFRIHAASRTAQNHVDHGKDQRRIQLQRNIGIQRPHADAGEKSGIRKRFDECGIGLFAPERTDSHPQKPEDKRKERKRNCVRNIHATDGSTASDPAKSGRRDGNHNWRFCAQAPAFSG